MIEPFIAAASVDMPDVPPSANERAWQAMADLKIRGDSGASWFFFVALLSLVSTAVIHAGGNHHCVIGLAITTAVDVLSRAEGRRNPAVANLMMTQAICFSLTVAAIAILIGWLSRKRHLWVFGIGIFLYLLDTILYLLFEDYPSVGFHVYVLYGMIQGLRSYRQLKRIEQAVFMTTDEKSHAPDF